MSRKAQPPGCALTVNAEMRIEETPAAALYGEKKAPPIQRSAAHTFAYTSMMTGRIIGLRLVLS